MSALWREFITLFRRNKSPRESGGGGQHLHCATCRYDLFGLPAQGDCPECGNSVFRSALVAARNLPDAGDLHHAPASRVPFAFIREQLGYPIDAFLFVSDFTGIAWEGTILASLASRQKVRHARAAEYGAGLREFRTGLRDFALNYFGDAPTATAALAAWGVRDSADFGRIVFHLVFAGAVKVSEEDSLADFNNLFTLATLFPTDPPNPAAISES